MALVKIERNTNTLGPERKSVEIWLKSEREVILEYIFILSVNRRTLENGMYLLIELMKRMNRRGLRCLSWGTPEGVIDKSVTVSRTFTNCILGLR